jgi:xanthine/uracil/vitamin C permease (AzgA family)
LLELSLSVRGDIGRAKSTSGVNSGSQRGLPRMIEESIYLAIAVFKVPLLVILPVGLVASFLVFVGKMSPVREGHRYE